MLPDGQSTNVLQHEYGRFEFNDQAEEMFYELVSRVIQSPFADHGKTLARRASNDYVDRPG